MKLLLAVALLLAISVSGGMQPAMAQQMDANVAFKSVYGPPTPDQQQANLNAAIASLQAQRGGFGPAVSNTTIGTLNETNTYNGPVSNSGAQNSINSNQFSSTITAEDSTVTLTAPTSQSSSQAGQTATATTITTEANPGH